MALTKFKINESQPSNDFELQCSAYGCNERWSVKIEKPLCSFHQWKQWPVRSEAKFDIQENKDNIHDPKWWAKRILRDHNAGMIKPIAVVEMAKRALKVTDDVESE
jgi:hypothetical protein